MKAVDKLEGVQRTATTGACNQGRREAAPGYNQGCSLVVSRSVFEVHRYHT